MTTLPTLPHGVRLIKPPERPFWVLESRATLILDWDIETQPTAEAALSESFNVESGCCTISCTQDAVTRLEAYAELCQDQLWAVYETGKGVRAFRLDKTFPTDHVSLGSLMLSLDPDRKYMNSSLERQHWAARVSHKEGRPDEQIRFLQWIGTNAAMSEQWAVLKLHHELLQAHRLSDVPFDELVKALEAHLKVPSEDYSCFY